MSTTTSKAISMSELETKLTRIGELLAEHNLDALLLQGVTNFAWVTCGASSYVNTASNDSVAALLITPTGRHIFTNNIEAPRLEQGEGLKEQGWEFHVSGWQEASDAVASIAGDLRLGADGPYPGAQDLSREIPRLRMNLLPAEQERFRALGHLCAEAMNQAIRAVQPGMTEFQIAAILGAEAQRRGVLPIVNLIATDERIFSFRHPLPTAKQMDRYAMLVLCGRQHGLVCSITRLVHFGPLPDELRRKAEAVATVDAAFIAATRPGQSLSEVFKTGQAAYAKEGFPDEWRLHHQGGPAGYEPREIVATTDTHDVVAAGQVYAWNPSITGTKSEDTILVHEEGFEILTEIEGWPTVSAVVDGQSIPRPATLETT
jgi:Xaa-Pro aminopeptidase